MALTNSCNIKVKTFWWVLGGLLVKRFAHKTLDYMFHWMMANLMQRGEGVTLQWTSIPSREEGGGGGGGVEILLHCSNLTL